MKQSNLQNVLGLVEERRGGAKRNCWGEGAHTTDLINSVQGISSKKAGGKHGEANAKTNQEDKYIV
jgi:hypothetical protein